MAFTLSYAVLSPKRQYIVRVITRLETAGFMGGDIVINLYLGKMGTVLTKTYHDIYVMILSGGCTYLGAGQDPGSALGLVWFGGFNVVNISSRHFQSYISSSSKVGDEFNGNIRLIGSLTISRIMGRQLGALPTPAVVTCLLDLIRQKQPLSDIIGLLSTTKIASEPYKWRHR